MNYIVYDLEFNQKSKDSIQTKIDNSMTMPFEIIQIGALKLNEHFETISTFNALIKPTIYKIIHPYVESLTHITNEKIYLCEDFINVYKDFLEFIGNDEIVLCIWGTTDIKELIRNAKFYDLSTSYISKYIDIQKYASNYLNFPKSSRIGLKSAIETLNIPIHGEFHDAFNDAFYTAEIFKLIHDDSMQPKIYTSAPSRRMSQPKEKVDMVSLINQFEKMYNREISLEEKSMIKTAYMMGKTRQFMGKNNK